MTQVKFRARRQRGPFDRMLNELLSADIGQTLGANDDHEYTPKVNIRERENDFQVEMLVPGLTKKDIEISVEENVLSINTKLEKVALNDKERFTRKEYTIGSFSRSFTLPEEVLSDKIKADFKNGVLTVSIPRAAKPEKISRKISIS